MVARWRPSPSNRRCLGESPRNLPRLALPARCRRYRNLLARGKTGRGSFVLAGQVIPANAQQFDEHLQSVCERVDFGALVVCPFHRYLDGDHSGLVAEEQDLGVEPPALDALPRKDGLGRPAGKGFEAALRVFEAQAQNDSQQQVEDTTEELTIERLALGLELGAQPARANGDVGALFDGSDQLVRFVYGGGKIGFLRAHSRTISGVESREPSLTTMISAVHPMLATCAKIFSNVASIRWLSL